MKEEQTQGWFAFSRFFLAQQNRKSTELQKND
jgi:hypothetical protein